jgi:murein L,D-transpeptidase YcbB/YkuD
MFPNKFNVYLHDSPHKTLFEHNMRAFSHGCIRVGKPIELAEFLLKDDPLWTREAILETIEDGSLRTVRLPQPIPVHLIYLTAWVDKDSIMHFRDDVYGRDKRLSEALRRSPPSP